MFKLFVSVSNVIVHSRNVELFSQLVSLIGIKHFLCMESDFFFPRKLGYCLEAPFYMPYQKYMQYSFSSDGL